MVDKCKNCGVKIIKFPLWKEEGDKRVFLWKNLFKMSLDSIFLLVVLVALVTAYKIDTAKCNEMVSDPLDYCDRTNACKVLAEQQFIPDTSNTPQIDNLDYLIDDIVNSNS